MTCCFNSRTIFCLPIYKKKIVLLIHSYTNMYDTQCIVEYIHLYVWITWVRSLAFVGRQRQFFCLYRNNKVLSSRRLIKCSYQFIIRRIFWTKNDIITWTWNDTIIIIKERIFYCFPKKKKRKRKIVFSLFHSRLTYVFLQIIW